MDIEKIKLTMVENIVWVVLILIIITFGILIGPAFLSLHTFKGIIYHSSMMGFLVFAEAVCLLSGNFDLSIAQLAGFAAMANAMLLTAIVPGLPWYVGIITIILIGAACGALNGFFIGKIGINPFLMTLGTYLAFMGGTLMISTYPISQGFPSGYLVAGGGNIGPVPIAIIIMLAFVVLLYFILNYTRFGSNIYSVGGNSKSARMAGINVGNTLFWVFTLSGILAAISGLLYTGLLASATPGLADGELFMAFAGAVIGGVSLSGGRGSITGVLGGILLIGVIQSGLTMLHVPPETTQFLFGVVVIVAILLGKTQQKMRKRILKR